MIWFFDTSVLVAVFYADHPHHVESQRAYPKSGKKDCCALRTIGELYATLTGLPLRPRINGSEGMEVVRQVCKRLSLISLSETEYLYALSEAASRVVGGGVYDALIAHCALKAGSSALLTWNVRDFLRLGPEIASIVKMPSEIT